VSHGRAASRRRLPIPPVLVWGASVYEQREEPLSNTRSRLRSEEGDQHGLLEEAGAAAHVEDRFVAGFARSSRRPIQRQRSLPPAY